MKRITWEQLRCIKELQKHIQSTFMFLNTLATLYEKTNQIDKAIETYRSAIEVSKKLKLGNEEGYQKEIERLKKI